EPRGPHAHLVQRAEPAEVVRLPAVEGCGVPRPPGTIPARPFVLLLPRSRRQPVRDDGPGLHVLRARLARPARRLDLQERHVQPLLSMTAVIAYRLSLISYRIELSGDRIGGSVDRVIASVDRSIG